MHPVQCKPASWPQSVAVSSSSVNDGYVHTRNKNDNTVHVLPQSVMIK